MTIVNASRNTWVMAKTKGAALLQAAVDKAGGQKAMALRLGVSESALSYWLSGQRTPDRLSTIILNERCKIPFRAWGEAEDVA